MKGQFECTAARLSHRSKADFLGPISQSFPSKPVPGDVLVLDVSFDSLLLWKNDITSNTVGWSGALITINSCDRWRKQDRGTALTSSDRWRKREKGVALTSQYNEAYMRYITVEMTMFSIVPLYHVFRYPL